ncbi:MAG: 2-oxoglutarate dehydrogenase complex dihydrolipoyllysine-residue succinyltransferase [Pelagibacterales bacterium]|nr:2-oxoglutarate dehydrogenase complex dihydrolipoyllysine-residue succinyltransferase [Pelagibacterales bacterium]
MATEIKVPSLGESVVEATVAKWYKNLGDSVAVDEPLVELETDKVTLEVPSPCGGQLKNISAKEGETVEVGALLGQITEGVVDNTVSEKVAESKDQNPENRPQETQQAPTQVNNLEIDKVDTDIKKVVTNVEKLSPAVRKIVTEQKIDLSNIDSKRSDGRITKGDLINNINDSQSQTENNESILSNAELRKEVPMSRLRQTIAKRLKDAQNNAAILTTFNEVDMFQLIETRNEYKESFESKYGVKLGFMSFFVKACVTALKEIPDVNAEIQDNNIIYKNFYNIGVAVGTDQGLVVPVVRDADKKSIIEIEKEIFELGNKARLGKLSITDMQEGTFTVSNGGVYGSLMSTPILNPPQSGVLGMHKIEKRPIVIDDEISIRPMMYLALSYDHRIIDGKAAVTFLVRVKEGLEDPRRLLLGV